MNKKILSEKALYFGKVDMPSGFEINREQLKSDILESRLSGEIRHSKSLDMLNAYIIENTRLKHKISLINHQNVNFVRIVQKTVIFYIFFDNYSF